MSGELQTPDEDIPQDPAVPGKEAVSDTSASPLPDEKDASAEDRERLDDFDDEGHMSSPDS
jgi:hypothetical protein